MIRFAASILALSCLLSLCATAQPGSSPPPHVVQLLPGDVVHERLVAMDSATYQAARTAVLLAPAADHYQADLRRTQHLADSLNVVAAELRRCRQQSAQVEAEFQQLPPQARQAASQPVRPPLLLDSHTWKGAGLGAAALLVLRVLVIR